MKLFCKAERFFVLCTPSLDNEVWLIYLAPYQLWGEHFLRLQDVLVEV